MNREQVIERLCILCSDVMHKQFRCEIPADCICENNNGFGFQTFDPRIIEFIEAKVRESLNH